MLVLPTILPTDTSAFPEGTSPPVATGLCHVVSDAFVRGAVGSEDWPFLFHAHVVLGAIGLLVPVAF